LFRSVNTEGLWDLLSLIFPPLQIIQLDSNPADLWWQPAHPFQTQ
jgi:hypothetical protein